METIVLHYLSQWEIVGYIIAFVGLIIEGDVLLYTLGFLTQQGYFDIRIMFVAVVLGAFLGDTLWYKAGKRFGDSNFFVVRWFNRIAKPFDETIQNNPLKAVFASKFAYSLHHAVLLRMGHLNIPLKKFVRFDFFAVIFWAFIIGGLGYASGSSFVLVKHYLKFAELALLIGILLFLLINHIFDAISEMYL